MQAPASRGDENGAAGAWDDAGGWAAEMDAVTFNHRLSDPPENAPTALHRGAPPLRPFSASQGQCLHIFAICTSVYWINALSTKVVYVYTHVLQMLWVPC